MAKTKKAKTWYCVTETYYDDGLVSAAIVDEVESIEQPKCHYSSLRRADVYSYWYGSIEAAKEAIDNAREEDC